MNDQRCLLMGAALSPVRLQPKPGIFLIGEAGKNKGEKKWKETLKDRALNELMVNFREEFSGISRFCRLEVSTDDQLAQCR